MKALITFLISLAFVLPACTGIDNTNTPSIKPLPPVAHIVSINPENPHQGDEVMFSGEGQSSSGKITAYRWRSALDGFLSDKAVFTTSYLSDGKHKIFFSVQDNNGQWSSEDTADVTVLPPVPAPSIDFFHSDPYQIGLSENSTLSWHVSGANIVWIDNGIGNVADSGRANVSPGISTRYTINASNEGGSVSEYVDVIVVPIRNFNLPVIRTFAANPSSISQGDRATLSWEVDYADAVQIDPDIGFQPPSGSVNISPNTTTKYTLTAYNSIGIIVGTTQILVGSQTGSGKPDLALTDIYKVVTPDGVMIGYSVENKGTAEAPETESKLYANGSYKDVVSLPVLQPGARIESLFKTWRYDPSTNIIRVDLDAGGNIVESDKSNNSMEEVFPVSVDFDFIANAPKAQWSNGYQPITFGGSPDDIQGAALYRTDKRLEDSSGPAKYLETRPRATFSGMITGDFLSAIQVKPGDTINAIVGLLEGSDAGRVIFEVYARATGETDWILIGSGTEAIYDYKLKKIDFPVPANLYGKKADFRLKVYNPGEPLQNQAAWVKAIIAR